MELTLKQLDILEVIEKQFATASRAETLKNLRSIFGNTCSESDLVISYNYFSKSTTQILTLKKRINIDSVVHSVEQIAGVLSVEIVNLSKEEKELFSPNQLKRINDIALNVTFKDEVKTDGWDACSYAIQKSLEGINDFTFIRKIN